jgi:flagellar hook protein FlgE
MSVPPFSRLPSSRTSAFIVTVLLLAGCERALNSVGNGSDSLDTGPGKGRLNDYDFLQGDFLVTGEPTDLAIEGRGFFVLRNESTFVYFRRPARFSQDADGHIHLGDARTRLQGFRLYDDGNPYPTLPDDSVPEADWPALEDVRWSADEPAPPKATTRVTVTGNLDANAVGKGSIVHTQALLHHAEATDLLTGLLDSSGKSLGIREGDLLTFSARTGASTISTEFTVASGSTLANLSNALTAFFRSAALGAGLGTTVDAVTSADSERLRGALAVYGNSAPILDLKIAANRPESGDRVTPAFAIASEIPAGTARLAVATRPMRAPALAADRLMELFDAAGNGLGLQDGDRISVSGSIGKEQASSGEPVVFATGPGGTTLGDLLDLVGGIFSLEVGDGSQTGRASVSLNPAASDDSIPDGSIVLRGAPGRENSLQDLVVRASDENKERPSPNFFNTNMNITTLRKATDGTPGLCSLDVYDARGKTHRMSLEFMSTATKGTWRWKASLAGEGTLVSGSRGTVLFGLDGEISRFQFDSSANRLEFDPGNGASRIALAIDAGSRGTAGSLTQHPSATTVAFGSQDGFAGGRLLVISIDEGGIVAGSYDNGKTRPLFRIPLADIPNPSGLKQVGDNSFLETPESGKASLGVKGPPAGAVIRPGEVEYLGGEERARICESYRGC